MHLFCSVEFKYTALGDGNLIAWSILMVLDDMGLDATSVLVLITIEKEEDVVFMRGGGGAGEKERRRRERT